MSNVDAEFMENMYVARSNGPPWLRRKWLGPLGIEIDRVNHAG